MTNPSKTKFAVKRGSLILGGTLACTLAMSAFGPAAMASEVDDNAAPDASVVEVVDLRVAPQESTESTESVVVVEPPAPAPAPAAPQADVVTDPPAQPEQVTSKVEAPAQSEVVVQVETPVVPEPAAADTEKPVVNATVPSRLGGTQSTFEISATDNVGVVKLVGNIYKDGVLVKSNVVNNADSLTIDVKSLASGSYTMKYNALDAAGNLSQTKTASFVVDNTGPVITVKPGAVNVGDIYSALSLGLAEQSGGKVVSVTTNGVVKNLTPNQWSDHNSIKPGFAGAVEGWNDLVVTDNLGNTTSFGFELDTQKPVINTPAPGQWVSGVHSFEISQTEANPLKAYVEINELVNGKWVKRDGVWLYNTNDLSAAFDTSKLTTGAEAQIKISSWDVLNQHSSTTFKIQVDNKAPVISIKPESIGSDGEYSKLDLKLHDAHSGVKQVSVNGHMLQRTINKWSDLNGLKPGRDGAVQGENTIVLYDAAGNTTTLIVTLDSVAPTATAFSQVYQAKEGGRVAVTLTFDEAVTGLGQGWNGSGTTWTKVYYSSKEHTVTFKDTAGNVGSYTFTVDATAPSVVNELQEWQSDKNRNLTTLTFSEPTTVSSQGWYAQAGSNNTVWSKAIFNTKEYTVEFTDAVGNPGTYVFKAKGQSDLVPPVIGEPEFPEVEQPETPVVTEPVSNNTGAGNTAATTPSTPIKHAPLPATGGNVAVGAILSGLAAIFGGLLLKLKSIFG